MADEDRVYLDIKLGKKWRLTSDDRQFILSRKREQVIKSTGKVKVSWIDEGYYNDIEHLIDELFSKELKTTEVKNLSALLKEVKAIRVDIKKYAESIKRKIR